jgi:hypothetical protein
MPWPARQRTAIFLSVKRRKGEPAARRFMHEHGHGGETPQQQAIQRQLKRKRPAK